MENSPKEICQVEVSGRVENSALASGADGADALGYGAETRLPASTVDQDGDPCSQLSSFDNLRTVEPENTGSDRSSAANDYEGAAHATNEDATNSSTHDDSEMVKDSGTYVSGMEEVDHCDESDERASDHTADHGSSFYEFTEPKLRSGDLVVIRKKSDFALEYDMVDPLEVARQVAIEVERQVVDCQEQSFNSSDGAPGLSQQPHTPDSAGEMVSHAQGDTSKQVSSGDDPSVEAAECRKEQARSAENPGNETYGTQDVECSQVTCMDRELLVDAVRDLCNFDLNQEVFPEEMDQPENQTFTSIPVVSASEGSAVPRLQISQLHFEVNNAHSVEESNNSSQLPDGYLVIDLNADSANEKAAGPLVGRRNPGSSGLPSGESSVEASLRISERLELDLNRVMNGDGPSDWQSEREMVHLSSNGNHSRTPSSSSSSSKIPSLRNIDLNDQPFFASEPFDHPCYVKLPQNFDSPGVKKADDSVISIFGTRLKVRRNDFVPCSVPLSSGRNPEPTLDVLSARGGGLIGFGSIATHANSTINGYAGLTSGMALALSSGIYGPAGPVPYILDARGAPVMPQVMGTSAFQSTFYQPPFIMNMASMPRSKGVDLSQGSFNLNSGLILEGGNRDDGGQLLNPGQQVQQADDNLTLNLFPSASVGAGTKRKQDPQWESNPFKHH